MHNPPDAASTIDTIRQLRERAVKANEHANSGRCSPKGQAFFAEEATLLSNAADQLATFLDHFANRDPL